MAAVDLVKGLTRRPGESVLAETGRKQGGLLILALLCLAVWGLRQGGVLNAFHINVATNVLINALAVVGLGLLIGQAGQVSLGHGAFWAIGAYGVALMPRDWGVPSLVAAVLSLLLAAGIAVLLGRPILRLKGHYLAMATLGLGILGFLILQNEAWATGGPDGMAVEIRPASSRNTWFIASAVTLLVGIWLARNLIDSPTGRALAALHDSENAARASGVDTAAMKLRVFVISALYATLAGVLSGWKEGFVTPSDTAGFIHSIELVTMVVLGGMGSVWGAVLGATVLTLLPQILAGWADAYETALLGLILMACMILMRRGLWPALQRLFGGARA